MEVDVAGQDNFRKNSGSVYCKHEGPHKVPKQDCEKERMRVDRTKGPGLIC